MNFWFYVFVFKYFIGYDPNHNSILRCSICFIAQNAISPLTLAQVAILLTRQKSVITSVQILIAAQRL